MRARCTLHIKNSHIFSVFCSLPHRVLLFWVPCWCCCCFSRGLCFVKEHKSKTAKKCHGWKFHLFYSFCGDFFPHGFLIPQRHIESKCAKRVCFVCMRFYPLWRFSLLILFNFLTNIRNGNNSPTKWMNGRKGEKTFFACIMLSI